VAEGVETEQQFKFAVHEGVEEIQGYLFGRPMPIESLARLVGRSESTMSNSAAMLMQSA
jgi:EAL domain-containing protein (putative c-di-GMP-specific phosphodiesterase class I)